MCIQANAKGQRELAVNIVSADLQHVHPSLAKQTEEVEKCFQYMSMHALHAVARTSVWRRRCFRVATSSSSSLLVARAASASPAAASRSACTHSDKEDVPTGPLLPAHMLASWPLIELHALWRHQDDSHDLLGRRTE